MSGKDEALKQARSVLRDLGFKDSKIISALDAIYAALNEPQPEPIAHICILPTKDAGPTKFFTSPDDPRGFPVAALQSAIRAQEI